MARPRKYKIELTDEQLKYLKSVIRKKIPVKRFDADAGVKLSSLYPKLTTEDE